MLLVPLDMFLDLTTQQLWALVFAWFAPSLCTNILPLFAGLNDVGCCRVVVFAAHGIIIAVIYTIVNFLYKKNARAIIEVASLFPEFLAPALGRT